MKNLFKMILGLVIILFISGCDLLPTDSEKDSGTSTDTYEITFNSNGGLTVDSLTVNEDESITEPNTPTKEGNTFLGWFSDSTLNTAYDFTQPVIGDINLHAKWNVNQYAISFNTNGGNTIEDITLDYGTTIDFPDNPIKEGYVFSGWFNEDLNTEYELDDMTMGVEGLTFYAKWVEDVFTVSFSEVDGTVLFVQNVTFGNSAEMPNDPVIEGKVFGGWYIDSNFTTEFNFTYAVLSDLTIYAKFNSTSLNIYFVPSRPTDEILTITEPLSDLLMDELLIYGFDFSEININVSSSYESAATALTSGQADVAFLPFGTYAAYVEEGELSALLSASRFGLSKDFDDAMDWNDGLATERSNDVMTNYYRGLIIAGTSTAARTLANKVNSGTALVWDDVKDLNWCVRSLTSSSGYVFPNLWLQTNFDGKTFDDLTNVYQTSGYGDTMAQLSFGGCDVGTIYADARRDYADEWIGDFGRTLTIWDETDVIGVTVPIYNDLIATSNLTVDAALREALQDAFMSIIGTDAGEEVFSVYAHYAYSVVDDLYYEDHIEIYKLIQ